MRISQFLSEFEKVNAVSGNEKKAALFLKKNYSALFDETHMLFSNSFLGIKKSNNPDAKKILFDAHLDRIGFVVSEIFDGGFIKCNSVGGIDTAIIPSTEFIIHGKNKFRAIASNKPVHLISEKDRNAKLSLSDIYFDTGMSDAKSVISIGDTVTFAPTFEMLDEDTAVSSGLDNMVSVAALLYFAENIKNCKNDLYFLFSSGEETSSLGIKSLSEKYCFDFAYVLDAGFGYTDGMDEFSTISMGKGPSVSFTDTLNNELSRITVETLNKNGIECQILSEPASTGTNATALQISNGGIPSCVISIPIKNMHTPCETVKISDIEKTGKAMKILEKQRFSECEEKKIV